MEAPPAEIDQQHHRSESGIVLASVILLWAQVFVGYFLTYGQWLDSVIDFGRERYIPERLAVGEVLYRDLAYFNGPFSPWCNAGLFRIFGASIRTLAVCNLFLLLAFVLGFYVLLSKIAERKAALLGTSVVIWLCAFCQYSFKGANMNWICPYSHDLTHGLLLSLAAIFAAEWFCRKVSLTAAFVTGLLCGLIFLTKCEIALAAYTGVAVLLLGTFCTWRNYLTVPQQARIFTSFATGFAFPIVAAVAYLNRHLPLGTAWWWACGSWKYLGRNDLTNNDYYRKVMGTFRIGESLQAIYGWSVIYVVVLGMGAWIGHGVTRLDRSRSTVMRLLAVSTMMLILLLVNMNWMSMARPWPLVIAFLAVRFGRNWWKVRGNTQDSSAALLRVAVLVWSGMLVLKIILFCRVFHYGFVLAVPALGIMICAGWDWWPNWLQKRGVNLFFARSGVLAIIIAGCVSHLAKAASNLSEHKVPVGQAADRFLEDESGTEVNLLLAEIQNRVPSTAILSCLPEGVMLNALSNRRTSLRYLNFVPCDMLMFGEQAMFDNLQAAPPDWIALINRDTSEYGFDKFTIDYAQPIGAWIRDHYEVRVQHGAEFMTAAPGFTLLQRRPTPRK